VILGQTKKSSICPHHLSIHQISNPSSQFAHVESIMAPISVRRQNSAQGGSSSASGNEIAIVFGIVTFLVAVISAIIAWKQYRKSHMKPPSLPAINFTIGAHSTFGHLATTAVPQGYGSRPTIEHSLGLKELEGQRNHEPCTSHLSNSTFFRFPHQ
jgi:hypothetical protein